MSATATVRTWKWSSVRANWVDHATTEEPARVTPKRVYIGRHVFDRATGREIKRAHRFGSYRRAVVAIDGAPVEGAK